MPHALVVDDSSSIRTAVVQLLSENGWTAEGAPNAEEGAVSALSSRYDAIVADLWMPGLSGLQMCRLLRANGKKLPIVLLTASSDRRNRFWAEMSGATAFLDKRSVRNLPDLLGTLRNNRTGGPSLPPNAPIDGRRVAAQLGHLLDNTLFDSVVTGKLRGLALEHDNLSGFFGGLAKLLSSLLAYRWMALQTQAGQVLVHAGADDAAATDEAREALGVSSADPCELVTDEPCCASTGQMKIFPLSHGGQPVGRLAIGLESPEHRPDDEALLELTSCEIALPLRLLSLLEDTRERALTDELTGLPNRRAGIDSLNMAMGVAARRKEPVTVGVLDIDRFKRVNDTYGHAAGDTVIKHVARLLRTGVRQGDRVMRWGGEEFLILLPHSGTVAARFMADRVRGLIARTPARHEGITIPVTVSIGLAMAIEGGGDWQTLVQSADEALYRAKAGGRNRIEVAS